MIDRTPHLPVAVFFHRIIACLLITTSGVIRKPAVSHPAFPDEKLDNHFRRCIVVLLVSNFNVLQDFPPLDDTYQYHYNSNDEQNVDQAAHGIGSNHT